MANYTSNYLLTKPAYTDTADIEDINGNMDKVDTALHALGGGLAIMSYANQHAAISKDQYVYIYMHANLAEGLYKALSNISANATLNSSNVQAVSGGLGSAITTLNDQIATHDNGTVSVTPATGVTVAVGGAKSADVKYLRFTISNTSLTNAKEICTVPSAWCPVSVRPYFPALNDDTGAPIGMFILNANGKLMYYGTSTNNTVVCGGLYI